MVPGQEMVPGQRVEFIARSFKGQLGTVEKIFHRGCYFTARLDDGSYLYGVRPSEVRLLDSCVVGKVHKADRSVPDGRKCVHCGKGLK
jgi:hypothetical protein